jgi:hypothetical protein
MPDNEKIDLPIGIPFVGGSDDPFDLIGIRTNEGGYPSSEDEIEDDDIDI